MSSVSGAAAGNPSNMTVATSVASHEHHWLKEPTEPAKKGYVTWLIIAQFVFFVALLGPAIVGIGIKITSLVEAGAIPENGATGAGAVLGGVGALFATIGNVVFGRLSDRTASKWGRRRIWVVLGTVIMTVAFAIMALAPNLFVATVGWALAQLGANMTLAPFIATIADQVPKFQRGKVTAAVGIAQNVGILGGTYVAEWFRADLVIMFVGPSILAIAAMVIFAVVLPDRTLPAKPPRATFREWWETFWVSPRQYPDYGLAWWSRFMIMFASFGFTTFRYFYLMNHVGVSADDVVPIISLSVLIYTLVLVPTSILAGWWSDRIGKRKVFVWSSTALFALGTVALIFVQDVPTFFILEALMGIAYGIYVGVDLALVVDVLPNPDDSGKDLGVFNMANALPQTFAPAIGGIIVYIGSANGSNYALWFSICGVLALIGALVIFPIKKVK
ncbi:2-acyl-glycerophospho-ethanolamine acyltransferase [Microbacterium hydrocarbonoxydans]|uniref:2-acyl-glycerophospho-ethanolamine acyltransferase n=1 Tax=Microbacterium hydrocarbonoxydans TaxID=273678 RepID=A0A0M2HV73_9MICO|nr:MFS transporter [Microbacterium hydrocarbonoxydans]KJL48354.1 2-acyl-glycerophospho-ethanolamine acyltransferase [Microbacterium hydrocarbonoxydans]